MRENEGGGVGEIRANQMVISKKIKIRFRLTFILLVTISNYILKVYNISFKISFEAFVVTLNTNL